MAMDYKLRVLVVDDSDDMRLLLKIVLNGIGCVVCGEATNGVDAIAQAEGCNPDMIVLDITMPVMDGLSCLPILHAACPDAVIVMFSAGVDSETRVAVLANGATAMIDKNRMDTDLIPIIRTACRDIDAAHRAANRPTARGEALARG